MAGITPLLSAARLLLPVLPALSRDHQMVAAQIESILQRARTGDDVDALDDELLSVVEGEERLRRHLHLLVMRPKRYRSTADRWAADAGHADATWFSEGNGPTGDTRPEEARSTETHVNAFVSADGQEPWEQPLQVSAQYAVMVHVGAPVPQSLLDPSDAVLELPDPRGEGAWIRALLDVGHGSTPAVADLFVTANGESFACGCTPGSEHRADCRPQPWARLPFRTPDRGLTLSGTLVIYHEAVALHVQELTLPVGTPSGGPTSRLVSRVVSTFQRLDDLQGRSASVVLTQGSPRVTVNGLGFTASPFSLTAGRSDTAVLEVRGALLDAHLSTRNGKERSRYDAHLAKPRDEFLLDLARLAQVGSEVYASVFDPTGPDETTPWSLPALLRHEALMRDQAPLLQVADPHYSDASVVWQAIYDLPMGSDPSAYVACPSLEDLDSVPDPAPGLCPYDEDHRGQPDVLCPWGFWGLSVLLDQPPGTPVPAVQSRPRPMTCVVVRGPRLEPLAQTHLEELMRGLGPQSVRSAEVGSSAALAKDLSERLDVAYFYCHCGYRERASGAGVERYLDLGEYSLSAQDFISWARSSEVWPRDHWAHQPPLVVLNGCHTTEFSTRTLNGFVPALTRWARAGGVVGTEITVHQSVANWVGETLLRRLWSGATVSAALRDLRWQLLRRGNLMGLAYTAYCRGDLALSAQEGSSS